MTPYTRRSRTRESSCISERSPLNPSKVLEPIFLKRQKSKNFARDPYDPDSGSGRDSDSDSDSDVDVSDDGNVRKCLVREERRRSIYREYLRSS